MTAQPGIKYLDSARSVVVVRSDDRTALFNTRNLRITNVPTCTDIDSIWPVKLDDAETEAIDHAAAKSMGRSDQLDVSFALSYSCNLACSYCYASGGIDYQGDTRSFDKSGIDSVIREAIARAKDSKLRRVRLSITGGGEPLLRPDLLEHLLRSVEVATTSATPVDCWFVTNGTVNVDRLIRILEKYRVQFGVSFDGPAPVQDIARRKSDGGDTYEIVRSTLKRVFESEYLSPASRAVWGLCVIHSKNTDLLRTYRHLLEVGFSSVQMKWARLPIGHELSLANTQAELAKQYNILISALFTDVSRGDTKAVLPLLNDNDFLGKLILRLLLEYPVRRRCGAGESRVAVGPDMTIAPCDSFLAHPGLRIEGLVRDVHTVPGCKHCYARFLCGGGCYYQIEVASKTEPRRVDSLHCSVTRLILPHLITQIAKCKAEVPARLKSLARAVRLRNRLNTTRGGDIDG